MFNNPKPDPKMKILAIISLKKKHFQFLILNTRDSALFHIMKMDANSSPQKDRP